MSDDTSTTSPTAAHPMDAAAAGSALRAADALAGRTRRSGLWYSRYMQVFGVGFGVMTLLIGLGPDGEDGLTWALVCIGAWGVFMVGMLVWATRRPVQGLLSGRTYVPGWIGTGLLYAAALGLGLNLGLPAWAWVVAGVVVPGPMLVSAALLRRSLP